MVGTTAGTDWMSTDEAASELGVGVRTLYRFIDREDLPAYKLGRVIRLRRSDLLAWLEDHRIEPGDLAHLVDESDAGSVEEDGEPEDGPTD